MATNKDIRRGLEIFAKYTGEDANVCAEHDVVYAEGPHKQKMSKVDIDELDALGWFTEEEDPDPDCSQGWQRFT